MYVIEKALQSTCLNMNWCEVPLLYKSQYLNKDKKEEEKSLFEVKRKLLKYSISQRISKLKGRIQ